MYAIRSYYVVLFLGVASLITLGVWGKKTGIRNNTISRDYSKADKSMTFNSLFTEVKFSGVFDLDIVKGVITSYSIHYTKLYDFRSLALMKIWMLSIKRSSVYSKI